MNKINVIGLGPGNPDYITPAAQELIRGSDVIIGGERNLRSIDLAGKESITIADNLENIVGFVKENHSAKNISIIASGDPGFFGILAYLKKYFSMDELNVVPGISSMQYMFARLGYSWDDAYLGSVHGRDEDIAAVVSKFSKAAFLTDHKRSYQYIAWKLSEAGYGEKTMFVGANLSYDNEIILKDKAKNFAKAGEYLNLCVVMVTDEE